MELQHVNVKVLVKNPEGSDLEPLIPVFHSWIQDQVCAELLLDVADYRHVPAGPGVVLIGHEANYSLDNTGDRWGVRYNRKARLEGTNQDRLAQAVQAALAACQRLEADPRLSGKIRFAGREIEVFINDRLLAPNTDETRAAADSEFRAFFSRLFGSSEFALAYPEDPRSLFSVWATAAQPFDTFELLNSLHSLAPVPGRR
jgi:hypothetical protein